MIEPEVMDAMLRRHLASKGLDDDIGKSCWTIDRSKLGGRGMFATRDIAQDEIIFVDAPLVVGPRCYDKYLPMCINCYRSGCPLFPCERGCGLPVCSDDCENSSGHGRIECDYLRKWVPNCGTMWSMELLQAVVPIRALSLNQDQRDLVGAFEWHPRHVRELDLLKKNLKNEINSDDESFMIRVCQVLDTGAFETAAMVDKTMSISLRGLYPMGALQNHCCVPNTRHHFDNGQLLYTRAAVPIKKGEELTMTYTDLIWDTSLRRRYLKMSKHFDCACERCSDPTEFGTLLGALRCANINCFGNMFPNDPLNNETAWTCEDCSLRVSSRQIKSIRSGLGSIVNEIIYKTPKEMLKFVKGELSILVPATSSIMMDMKFRIISYFGRTEGLSWEICAITTTLNVGYVGRLSLGVKIFYGPSKSGVHGTIEQTAHDFVDLSDAELRTKAQYCEDLVSVLDNLGCGDCQKKGLILYEWYRTNVELTKREMKNNHENEDSKLTEIQASKPDYASNEAILKKAVQILKHDIAAPDDLSLVEIEA